MTNLEEETDPMSNNKMETTLAKIYKRTKTGAVQEWQAFAEGDQHWTVSGQVGGKLTTSARTTVKGKNLGRANATTAEEQAIKDIESKQKHKLERGYSLSPNNIDTAKKYFDPMTAADYNKVADKHKPFPAFVQPKFDGIRAVIRLDKETNYPIATTRGGKTHMAIPHILEALVPFFKGDPTAILDGELYNHELHDEFEKICSMIRKQKPTEAQLAESERYVQFYCYDAPRIGGLTEKDNFRARRTKLLDSIIPDTDYIKTVLTIGVEDHEELVSYHDEFVTDGYEGLMYRQDAPYENKRSKGLLKYKRFDDAEWDIEAINEGAGKHKGLAATITCRTEGGKEFHPAVNGTHEFLKECFENQADLIGKPCTVQYFGLTKYGVPRFPKMIAVRDYE